MRQSIYDRLPAVLADWRRTLGDQCWPWPWCKINGYGTITIRRKGLRAHRVVYEMVKGAIPAGLHIDHLCRNTACVNPDHLDAVTPKMNALRSLGITANHARSTHCKRGHEFSADNTYIRPSDGGRICLECQRIRWRKRTGYKGNVHGKDKTHCAHGHEFTPENTHLVQRKRRRAGQGIERACRKCTNEKQRRYYERQRAG